VDAGPAGSATYRLMAEAPEGRPQKHSHLRAALSLLGPEAERKVSFLPARCRVKEKFHQRELRFSLAQQGHRVLLVDGDLRRPSLHKIFRRIAPSGNGKADLERTRPGLSIIWSAPSP